MNKQRRAIIKLAVAAGGLALMPLKLLAEFVRPEQAFAATKPEQAFAALGDIQDSGEIELETPDIAENGAVVPVGVTSKLPDTQRIYIFIEKNPNPLAAVFMIPEGTEPFVQTRVKVAQTCMIFAVVEANGKLYRNGRETKVTLGGCGG